MNIFFVNDWGLAFGFTLVIFILLVLADLVMKILKIQPASTRRIVHILVGILVITTPFLFSDRIPVLAIAAFFTLSNWLARKSVLFDGIHAARRDSLGTVYFPVSFALLVGFFWDRDPAILITAMLVMALGDPIAGWVGESVRQPIEYKIWRDRKSVQGSLAMFTVSFITIILAMPVCRDLFGSPVSVPFAALSALFAAVFATISESISHNGTDNLSVPLGTALILDMLYNGSPDARLHLMLWMLLTTGIAWGAYKLKTLSVDGAVAAWVMGVVVFGFGGSEWIIPLAFFFLSSSLFSRIGHRRKTLLRDVFEKGHQRDFYQVFANGGVGMAAAVAGYLSGQTLWFLVFLAALAAATADTWATELGTLNRGLPRSILNFKPVPQGQSGAISPTGTAGALVGSALISAGGIWLYNINHPGAALSATLIFPLLAAGFFGSLIDSLAGATLQAQYECSRCGRQTEKKQHCNQPARQIHGHPMIDNDMVNAICTVSAAVISVLFLKIFM